VGRPIFLAARYSASMASGYAGPASSAAISATVQAGRNRQALQLPSGAARTALASLRGARVGREGHYRRPAGMVLAAAQAAQRASPAMREGSARRIGQHLTSGGGPPDDVANVRTDIDAERDSAGAVLQAVKDATDGFHCCEYGWTRVGSNLAVLDHHHSSGLIVDVERANL
jgi:hypothetical protein